jgi:hypothetical protein
MRFLSLLICFFLAQGKAAQAQSGKTIPISLLLEVPAQVEASFARQFAAVTSKQWRKTWSGHYVALFTNDMNQLQLVEYDTSGIVLKKKISYPADRIPEQVQSAIAASYPAGTVKACTRLELPGIKTYYKATVAHTDQSLKELLISEEGTVSE